MPSAAFYAGGALLVVNGELPPAAMIRALLPDHAPLVATDGAALQLRARAILPDVIIGDLDSIGAEAAGFVAQGVNVLHRESQEENDLEKALVWVVEQGIESATLIGTVGGAADHTLNNFSVIAKFARRLRIRLCDAASTAYLVPDSIVLDVAPGDRISLIPLPSAVVETSGLAWPLHRERLTLGVREGVSNRATKHRIEIRITDGLVAVFHYG